MQPRQVIAVLHCLEQAGIAAWIGGGWAVDAVVGRQTRAHQDLDLAVDADELAQILELLGALGFVVAVDWLPVRAELAHADGRRVDLHPVRFAADGSGVQAGLDGTEFGYPAAGFGSGRIDGQPVRCLSARQQLAFREGYEWREVDRHDVALLRTHVSLTWPAHRAALASGSIGCR